MKRRGHYRWVLRRTKDKTVADQLPAKVDQIVYCQPSDFQVRVPTARHIAQELQGCV